MADRATQTSVPTSIGNVSGQPAGVDTPAASGAVGSSDAAHTHTLGNHTHGGTATGLNQGTASVIAGTNVTLVTWWRAKASRHAPASNFGIITWLPPTMVMAKVAMPSAR